MAKKEEEKKKKPEKLIDSVKETFSSLIADKLKEGARALAEELIHKAQDIIYQTEKRVIDSFSAAVLALAGFILIVLAFAYFMIDFLKIQRYWIFLIAGLILIIVSLIIMKSVERTKYYDFRR